MKEVLLIIDFGSQYTQLIARRVRELNVCSEIIPYNKLRVIPKNVKGVILSGSPSSVNEKNAPIVNLSLLRKKTPLLALCYGAQLIAHQYGGKVGSSNTREYGRSNMKKIGTHDLFLNVQDNSQVWMSHGDTILKLPSQAQIISSTEDVKIAGFSFDNVGHIEINEY